MLHAIAIGIDRYADPRIRDLACARHDAHTFGSLLSERIEPAQRRVTMLLDERATRANIMQAIGEDLVRAARPEDIAIIYFAGHGSPERAAPRDEDRPYLIAHDTQYDRIYSTGIDMIHDVSRWLDGGWVDTFRHYEKGGGNYSWWSQRFGVRARNVGWRIDYVLASPGAMPFLKAARIHPEVQGSDHCPVSVELDPAITGARARARRAPQKRARVAARP